jgi:hypothetical protein
LRPIQHGLKDEVQRFDEEKTGFRTGQANHFLLGDLGRQTGGFIL